MYGELVPSGGGDSIPLFKKSLLVGRRESCDIILRFSNVSAHHCQLDIVGGYWYVRDLKSRNGVKVNGARVHDKRLDPGDVLSIAKHHYLVQYSPVDNGAVGPPRQIWPRATSSAIRSWSEPGWRSDPSIMATCKSLGASPPTAAYPRPMNSLCRSGLARGFPSDLPKKLLGLSCRS